MVKVSNFKENEKSLFFDNIQVKPRLNTGSTVFVYLFLIMENFFIEFASYM